MPKDDSQDVREGRDEPEVVLCIPKYREDAERLLKTRTDSHALPRDQWPGPGRETTPEDAQTILADHQQPTGDVLPASPPAPHAAILAGEIAACLNRHSRENASNTPDYILAQYLLACLRALETAVQQRETWYGRDARPTGPTI